jgi:hypothetical protein
MGVAWTSHETRRQRNDGLYLDELSASMYIWNGYRIRA